MEQEVLEEAQEMLLQGAPVSEGIAIGKPFFMVSLDEEESTSKFFISDGEIENEIVRYRKALSSSREELKKLHSTLHDDAKHIIDAHIHMLSDPLMTTHVEEQIRVRGQNTEAVFRTVMGDFQEKLGQAKDALFQERIFDVIDLSKRILGHLRSNVKDRFSKVPSGSIVFAKELVPSETAAEGASRISAFVTQVGGGSSHAALIARSRGIPFVASIDMHRLKLALKQDVIVNGYAGDVILNPTQQTLEKYRALQQDLQKQSKQLQEELHLNSETRDGHHINLFSNVGSLLELEEAIRYGAKGIGLFRTEFLLSGNSVFLRDEELQFETYRQAVILAQGMPLVIRLFDIGGDKFPELIFAHSYDAIGCRGIRFLLRQKQLLKVQLRALLRASQYGEIRVLIPLITDMDELKETKRLIAETRKELTKEKIKVKKLLLGCLIEAPAAVMISDALAKECDFFSLGTNDLIQYLLGVERSALETNAYFFHAHPSVVGSIKRVVESAKKRNITVTLCGEIATNPLFIPLLLGLGIDAFSCSPRYLFAIKNVVRQCNQKQAVKLANSVLRCSTSERAAQILKTFQVRREG